MDKNLFNYDLRIIIPLIVMFFLIFAMIYRTVKKIGMFKGAAKFIVALCVSLLAILGFEKQMVSFILFFYSTTGFVFLIILIFLIILTWFKIVTKRKGK
jgi:hypothetical protein